MDSRQINEHAQAIILGLSSHNGQEIFFILTAAISLIVSKPNETEGRLLRGAGYLFRPGGRRFGGKIDRYQGINAFLYEINHYITLVELQNLLVEKFGKVRAPSIATLSKFFRKLENRKNKNRMQHRTKK